MFVVGGVVTALACGTTSRADEPGEPATQLAKQGEASDVSDWAQAGVLWSQAHYAKKLATTAAAQQPNADRNQFVAAAQRYDNLIDNLEEFGWRRIVAKDGQSEPNGRSKTPSSSSADDVPLPDPADVGQQLRSEISLPGEPDSPASNKSKTPRTIVASPQSPDPLSMASGRAAATNERNSGLDRFNTETPAGGLDPAADDEIDRDLESIDMTTYRVDDVVDETRAERMNVNDAIEDGVEMAIAAGIDTARSTRGGRITNRELQTRSSTMAYSVDSIYDNDDFAGDYRTRNPLVNEEERVSMVEGNGSGLDAIGRGIDGVDDIDNEDELASQILGSDQTSTRRVMTERTRGRPSTSGFADQPVRRSAPAKRVELGSTRLKASPLTAATDRRDADWVDLTLAGYQTRWEMLASNGQPISSEILESQMRAIRVEILATAKLITRTSQSESLKNIAYELGKSL